MYDASNFLKGFGTKNLSMTENHKMVGFILHRADVTAADANLAAVTVDIDLSRSVNGKDNTIMIAAQRTAGAGAFTANLFATLPSDHASGELPFSVNLGDIEQPTATGLTTLTSLPAAKYKVLVTGVGTGTWQVYVAYSGNFMATSG